MAIGFAVLKYRLYAIDIIINRTLAYGALTAALVAVYFGGVATIQAAFRALTGQEQAPKGCSPKFAGTEFSEVRNQDLA